MQHSTIISSGSVIDGGQPLVPRLDDAVLELVVAVVDVVLLHLLGLSFAPPLDALFAFLLAIGAFLAASLLAIILCIYFVFISRNKNIIFLLE